MTAAGGRPPLVGCDFSSSPTPRKPIVLAFGHAQGECVTLEGLHRIPTLDGFARWLARPGPWLAGFDFPFGLPRALVQELGWPREWEACMVHYAGLDRARIRATFSAWCAARPVGGKFAHRAFDRRAGSSPSMKWVNPPVAYMLHAAIPLLIGADVHIPGLREGDRDRVALEAYPGLLARELVGRRSYKSDERNKQTPERLIARQDIVAALEAGRTRLGLRLGLGHEQRDALLQDASGDCLDAVLCLLQAAWGQRQGPPRYGLPDELDPLEGWIVTA
ncbi:DUF429 domain-containing protein [Ramlibacter sp.]|uniref:DUF429 domain-containing protein n=1 Tax=Ramlibacter sp. TaxID=1917967 RepID=UPI002FCC9648